MKRLILVMLCFVVFISNSIAQKKNLGYKYFINKTNEVITIDGKMNENIWKKVQVATDFHMVLPMDTSKAQVRTEVRMTYDDHDFYILATCFKKKGQVDMVESFKRDWSFLKNDNFLAFIDTYNDQTNGFAFGTNAVGAQCDGIMYEGGSVDWNWENKWISAISNEEDKYIWEAAIPFKTIRYKAENKEWGIGLSRNDLVAREKSSWAPVPRQFPTASLSYAGSIIWDSTLPQQHHHFALIPYVKSSFSKEFTNNDGSTSLTQPSSNTKDIGLDAKFNLSSSMNLDVTLHPDFSQVEVDRQVTNLSRFELFFPEKRQFFLENADLFANLGFDNVRPFFSRRIGLNTSIDAGARLTGRIDKYWRVGVLDMKTSMDNANNTAAQNFSVFALQRQLFKKSTLEFFYIDKTAIDYHSTMQQGTAFNRNVGFEYSLAPKNNTWSGKTIFIKSFSPNKVGDDMMNASNLSYSTKKWLITWQHEAVGNNYNAEVGYVPRNNYYKIAPSISRYFLPSRGIVLSHGPQFTSTIYTNAKWEQTDHTMLFNYLITFRDKSTLAGVVQNDYVELLAPFDPTRIGKAKLAAHTKHEWNTIGLDWVSGPQHKLTYALSTRTGGYYADGALFSITGDIGYRFQPYVNIDLAGTFNRINLPLPWGNNNFLLLGPKIDVTMTKQLFITAFYQYNEQTKNINFNTRLQWRYKPASDLFVVYTDNYYIGPVFIKNRAFVLKFNYWLN